MATFINRLTVNGDEQEFTALLSEMSKYMQSQPGFISHELYRSRGEEVVYVEIAHWTDADAHRRAIQTDEFRSQIVKLSGFASAQPGMFEAVDGH